MTYPRAIVVSILSCGLVAGLRADIGLDDSYEKVIAEMGQPTGKASMGDAVILRYPEGSIRLKAGKVTAINLKPGTAITAHADKPAPSAPVAATPAVASRAAAPAVAAVPLTWRTDYRAAIAEAKEQNRHIFLFFTGSDWCGWCMRLNREILSTAEFSQYASENLVLVEVDFPRSKAQPGPLKRQNATLQRAFQIEGYPTVVVLDANGKAVGRLGYQEGGPGPFITALKSF